MLFLLPVYERSIVLKQVWKEEDSQRHNINVHKIFHVFQRGRGRGVLVVVEPTCRVFTHFKNHKILYNLMVKGHKLLHIDVTTICYIYKILRPPLHGWYIDCRYGIKRKPQNNQSIKLNILRVSHDV